MRRRNLIKLLGGTAITAPLPVFAQQDEPQRRIVCVMPFEETDPDGQGGLEEMLHALRQLGWSESGSLHVDVLWLGADPASYPPDYATRLVQLKPELIFAASTAPVAALARATATIPIVFAFVPDPVGSGFATSLAKPGGNVTGSTGFAPGMIAKSLELLKEVAPATSRVSLLYNPAGSLASGPNFLSTFEVATRTVGMRAAALPVEDMAKLGSALAAGRQGHGIVVMVDLFLFTRRKIVVDFASRYGVPAIFPTREWAAIGGLISYGPEVLASYRSAAIAINRILRGAQPDEVPIEMPNKLELVINVGTAKMLGLTVPGSLLVHADEVVA